ncbi:MAG: hypothetical protein IPQ03_13060 [Bacteroidetes bacterium]|nr:hypothetical protein [Bacteroidota bacterium]
MDMTVWGDSLSDLIDFYGAVPFNYFGFVPRADYGNEPGFIDSFGDYFTLFGILFLIHSGIKIMQNQEILRMIVLDGQREVIPTGSHCIPESGNTNNFGGRTDTFNGKSALRSMVMIGGNDILFNRARGENWMPFLSRYAVDMTLENISLFVDWNIENGKKFSPRHDSRLFRADSTV